MDGVSWSTTRAQESFSRPQTAADTLSKLAKLIAQAEPKLHSRNQRQQPSHPSSFVCSECGKNFTYATDLVQHQKLEHTLPKPHRCPSCGKTFSLRSSLKLHKCAQNSSPCELCHGESRLGSPCPACTTRAMDPEHTQDESSHHQSHLLDSSPYACAPCGRSFSQKQALLHHQQAGCSEPPSSLTGNISSLLADSPPVSDGYSTRSDSSDTPGPSREFEHVCPFCLRAFRTQVGLMRHKQSSHVKEQMMTPKAQKKGIGGETREEGNIRVNGNPVKMPKSKQKLLSCRSCDMVFRSTANLYVHRKEKHTRQIKISRETRPVITKHRKRGTYPCQVCGKIFFHHLSLWAHSKQHAISAFPAIKNKSQSTGNTTKDSKSLEKRPSTEKNSSSDNKIVRAGPGRPRKVARIVEEFRDSGKCREVPKVEEEVAGEFPCPSCTEVFPLQSQLKEHTELHQSSVRKRQCSVCAQEMDTCKWPGSKRQRLYHCSPCQQGFSALDTFLEHCQDHLRARVEEDSIVDSYRLQKSKT
ncbi:hypothetical protein LDENG_00194560 [Lucifuga dentata]|nr:hypothetical protein LDENG_00194560 [Lucifuga dentata]